MKRRAAKRTAVFGAVERDRKVRATVVPDGKRRTLHGAIHEFVLPDAVIFADDWPAYEGIDRHYDGHRRINHSAKVYVEGPVHTQTIEGFWSPVKRGIGGNHHAVSAKYLQGYLNEYAWRYKPPEGRAGAVHVTDPACGDWQLAPGRHRDEHNGRDGKHDGCNREDKGGSRHPLGRHRDLGIKDGLVGGVKVAPALADPQHLRERLVVHGPRPFKLLFVQGSRSSALRFGFAAFARSRSTSALVGTGMVTPSGVSWVGWSSATVRPYRRSSAMRMTSSRIMRLGSGRP